MFRRFAAWWLATGFLLTAALAADTDHAAMREQSLAVLKTQFGTFRDAANRLAAASVEHCDGTNELDDYARAFRDTWLAWAPLDAYQFGPIEQHAAVLTVAFWPDKKDYVGRGLQALLSQPTDTLADPATISTHSAAVHGLPAIERLVFTDMETCPAIVGISATVETTAEKLFESWFAKDGYAELARSAGPDNPVFATDAEFTRLLFTAIDFELIRIADARLGRPLGSFDKPMPRRAEAWRSGLSLDIIDAQLAGLQTLLVDGFGITRIGAEIQVARDRIDAIGAPLDQAVSDPVTRIRAEALQSGIAGLQFRFARDVGAELGVDTGFSAGDGD